MKIPYITRDFVITVAILGILLSAITLVVVPGQALPDGIVTTGEDIIGDFETWHVASVLGMLVFVLAVWVLKRNNTERPRIEAEIQKNNQPEYGVASGEPTVGDLATISAGRYSAPANPHSETFRGNESIWVAIYGRRAVDHIDNSLDMMDYLDDIADLAATVYATSTGCDTDAAQKAVENGTWTDDRIAAAFLATDPNIDARLTIRERAMAWASPKRTFQNRISVIMAAIEEQASSYTTIDKEYE